MYTYYRQVESEDHGLYASEISKLLFLRTPSNGVAHHFVSAYLNEKMTARGESPLFYQTGYGLRQVFFSNGDVRTMIQDLLNAKESAANTSKKIVKRIKVGDKYYNVAIRPDFLENFQGEEEWNEISI
jgi:hypothetical protein